MSRRPHRPTAAEIGRVLTEHGIGLAMLLVGLLAGAFLRDPRFPLLEPSAWLPDAGSLLADFLHRTVGRFRPQLADHLAWDVFAVACLQYVMYVRGLYDRQPIRRTRNELLRLAQCAAIALIPVTLVFFFARPPELGRTAVVIGYALTVVALGGLRGLARAMRPPRQERVLIVGGGAAAAEVVAALRHADPPAAIAGTVGAAEGELAGVASLGGWSDLRDVLERETVHRILIAAPPPGGWDPAPVVSARLQGISVASAREHAENLTGQVHEDDPGVEFLTDATSRAYGRVSRLADIVLSVALLVTTLPLVILAALAVLVSSGRPVLFTQERIGLGGRRFRCFKLRTMARDAEAAGPAWSPENDPRITRVGRILRRFRLDELPQLINVLRGDLAFVGPRAEQPAFVQQLEAALPRYDLRHLVRPGLTGWAQVRCPYGSTIEDARRKLRFDLFYIKHRSPALDLAILFDTVRVVLRGQGR